MRNVKPLSGWAIIYPVYWKSRGPFTHLMLPGTHVTRHDCIARFALTTNTPWRDHYRRGYRCVKTVTRTVET